MKFGKTEVFTAHLREFFREFLRPFLLLFLRPFPHAAPARAGRHRGARGRTRLPDEYRPGRKHRAGAAPRHRAPSASCATAKLPDPKSTTWPTNPVAAG